MFAKKVKEIVFESFMRRAAVFVSLKSAVIVCVNTKGEVACNTSTQAQHMTGMRMRFTKVSMNAAARHVAEASTRFSDPDDSSLSLSTYAGLLLN